MQSTRVLHFLRYRICEYVIKRNFDKPAFNQEHKTLNKYKSETFIVVKKIPIPYYMRETETI